MKRAPCLWLAAGLLPLRLHAQPAAQPPSLIPTRDVDVLYRLAEGRSERMRWHIASHLLRVDPATPDSYVIVDTATRRVAFIRPAQRSVVDTTTDGLPVPAAGPGGFTRLDTDMIAGLPCTDWGTPGLGGTQTQSCLTDDGVLLRSRVSFPAKDGAPAHSGILLEATKVAYGPIDPASLAIPPDFTHTQDPGPQDPLSP